VAILKEGQYRGAYVIDKHRGQYPALCQNGSVTVYRDKDMDDEYDLHEEDVQKGIYGINIHRATANRGQKSTQVDKWSAGCQVVASYDDFEEFMEIMQRSRKAFGNAFTYTLISSADIAKSGPEDKCVCI